MRTMFQETGNGVAVFPDEEDVRHEMKHSFCVVWVNGDSQSCVVSIFSIMIKRY